MATGALAKTSDERMRERIEAAQLALPEGAEAAEQLARDVLDGPRAARASQSLQRSATHLLAAALAKQGRCAETLPTAEQALQAQNPGVRPLRFAIALNYECDDYVRAAVLLSPLRQTSPDDIAGLPESMVYRTAPLSDDVELLAIIAGSGWSPRDPATDKSALRLALVRALLKKSDVSGATAAARDLVDNVAGDFGLVIVLLTDRTFDPIIAADPRRFEFNAITHRLVDNAFANQSAHTDRLTVINGLAETLNTLGRSDEALLLVDDAISRIRSARRGSPPFTDIDQGLNWTYNLRANLRRDRGLEDDALSDLQLGAQESEGGRVNVSQRLNRASLLMAQHRDEDAIAAAQEVNPMNLSPYGRSVRRSIIICANMHLERVDAARAVLAEAIAHAQDSYTHLQAEAQCVGDLDIAEDAFAHRLANPSERNNALIELQGFTGEPPPTQWIERHPVYSRPNARAAIDAAARIRTFPIVRP